MGNYLGVKCPVCSKRFAQADDVVVCPVCGAPHHRQCYTERGECVFTQDHINGKEWRPPADESPPGQQAEGAGENIKTCRRCASANPPEALFCQICGNSLTVGNSPYPPPGQGRGVAGGWQGHQQDNVQNSQAHTYNPAYGQESYQDPYAGVSQNQTVGELSARDIAIFVGPNHAYFLERFYQIEKYGRTLQPNLAAGFLGFFYYFYRRMYMMGVAMLGIFMLSTVPFFMFFWEFLPEVLYQSGLAGPPEVAVDMTRVILFSRIFTMSIFFNITLSIVVSFFANRIYHRRVITKIRETMQAHRHTNEYQVFLPRIGGVDRLSVVLLGVLLLVGFNVIGSILLYNSNLL